MARVSRKAAIMQADREPVASSPERIYQTAIYVRLSVEDNNRTGDQESITMQRYMLEKFVSAQEDMRLCGIFCDNGETGTNFNRPDFERLMDEIRSRRIDCIVVKDLSRFGRNYVETGYYLEKIFPYLGVRFVAVNDSYDSAKDKGGNELILSLKNLVNDLYAKDISQKVNSAISTKQRNGEFIGAFPPYGYLKSPEDKHKLIIDPETAPVVRDIFHWKLEGLGMMQIARRLNERGIPSPAVYHVLCGHKKKMPTGTGAIWQAQIIKLMTGNPVYAGHMAQGKTKKSLSDGQPTTVIPKADWIMVCNTHEAIVDQETFDRVQAIKEQRHEECCSRRGKYPSTENIFKGMLICGDCGTKMVRYKNVSPAGAVRYTFICRVYAENLSGQGCSIKCVGEPELMEAVFKDMQIRLVEAGRLEKLLKKLQGQTAFQAKQKALAEQIKSLQQETARNTAYREGLFEEYTAHTLTEQEYLSYKQKYDQKAVEYSEKLAQLQQEEEALTKTLTPQNEWITALKKHRKDKVITRKMVLELIHHIKVTGYNEIEIVWNFQDEFKRLFQDTEGVGK